MRRHAHGENGETHMTPSAEVLLASLIDHAGTFPPTGLTLSDARAAYAHGRCGPCRSILGRFVIAADQLGEFESIAPTLATARDGCWNLTVVGTRESMPTSDRLLRFNQRWKDRATIVSVEFASMAAVEVLKESSVDAFVFTDEGLNWRGSRDFFVGFGSCSFTEPVDELARLGVRTLEAGSLAQPHAEVP